MPSAVPRRRVGATGSGTGIPPVRTSASPLPTPAPVADEGAGLEASAGVPSTEEEGDDGTVVGATPGDGRTPAPRRPTRRPKPGADDGTQLTADLVEQPAEGDDFLAAFDREFKNLKS